MSTLAVDPSIVQPGWTALVVVLLLAGALVFLYLSMRKQMRRIHVPDDDAPGGSDGADGPASSAQGGRPETR